MDALKKAEEGLEAAKKANASRITVQSSPSPSSLVSDFFTCITPKTIISNTMHTTVIRISLSRLSYIFLTKVCRALTQIGLHLVFGFSMWLLTTLAYSRQTVIEAHLNNYKIESN